MKMKLKYIVIMLLLSLVCLGLLSGCDVTESVERTESEAVKENMEEMNREIGMPVIDNFFEKKTAKMIFELRDNAELITYAYTINLEGRYVYLGQCIGFGLPYSVQYTNPDKITDKSDYGHRVSGWYVISQADPNGLYSADGLSATWLMLINDETGEPEVIYVESEIVVTQSKLPKRLIAPWSLTADY